MSQNLNSKNFTGIFLKLQCKILYLCTNSKRKHHDYKLLKLVFNSHMVYEYENMNDKFSQCQKYHV